MLPEDPLARLDHRELVWLFGILKDACRERLEKNLVSQQLEARLALRGPVDGRPDPRPELKLWEPRYRKLLEVATELHRIVSTENGEAVMRRIAGELGRRR